MEAARYPIIDVSSWPVVGTESAGLTTHEWLRDPSPDGGRDRLWLFKPVVSKNGHTQGENWVEKVSYEIGLRLGLPCAKVELCKRGDAPGCLSQDLRPTRWEMQPGAVLISELVQDYESNTKTRAGHNLGNVQTALLGISSPPGSLAPEVLNAFDVFAGYLVFDALVANRDRHDENWSVLRPPPDDGGPDCLSGSYDHASALGFGLTDAERRRRLKEGSVRSWALKGTAIKFEHSGAVRTLVELAADGLHLGSEIGRGHWLASVETLSDEVIFEILSAVPGLSAETITFVAELVAINRGRVLDEC